MKIFKLSPIDPQYSGWKYSTICENLIVRSENEKDARCIAVSTFAIMAEVELGGATSCCPWDHSDRVTCIEIEDSRFSPDGEKEILSPSKYNYEFERTKAKRTD